MTARHSWLNRQADALWRQAGLPGRQRLPWLLALGALLGTALAAPIPNLLLLLAGAGFGGWLPIDCLRWRRQRRQASLDQAAADFLPALAGLVRSLRHPLPALNELAPRAPKLLREPLRFALASVGSGQPLPAALTRMAVDLGDHFYLHQLAALVSVNLRQGGDLAGSLDRLSRRLHDHLELKAEAAVEVQGYRTLIVIMMTVTFAPVVWWGLTGASQWQFLQTAGGSWLLTWAVISSLLIYRLPGWLARYV